MPRILSQHGDLPRTRMPSVEQQIEKRPLKLLGEGQSTSGNADIVEDHDPPRLARLLLKCESRDLSWENGSQGNQLRTSITGAVVSCRRRRSIHRVTTRSVRSPNIQASIAIRRRPREAPIDVTRTSCVTYWLSSSTDLVCSTAQTTRLEQTAVPREHSVVPKIVPTFTDFEYCLYHAPSPAVLLRPYAWIFYFGFPSTSQLRIGILCRMLGKFRWPF